MSHELRTPLNAILGFTQLMIQSSNGETKAQLQGILDNGNHLLSLINNLLTAAQIETGKLNINLTQVNLPKLLAQLHNSFALQAKVKGLELVWCNETDLPYYLETDGVKLRQILINLLDNALKFTHQGKITFIASQNNNFLIFTIQDTGEGIAPEEIRQLFQPFTQTTTGQKSLQGTGLGLSVTQQLVKQLGGEIIVNSREGRGTIFRVVLPLQNISAELILPGPKGTGILE
jgi:signal transduction histidine kinase